MIQLDRRDLRRGIPPEFRLALVETPGPGVAKPDGGQQMKRRRVRAAIDRLDADQDVVRSGLGVFDEDIEVAVVVEDTGVDQLELEIALAAPAILLEQAARREIPAAGTCRETSCTSASASSRDKNSIP